MKCKCLTKETLPWYIQCSPLTTHIHEDKVQNTKWQLHIFQTLWTADYENLDQTWQDASVYSRHTTVKYLPYKYLYKELKHQLEQIFTSLTQFQKIIIYYVTGGQDPNLYGSQHRAEWTFKWVYRRNNSDHVVIFFTFFTVAPLLLHSFSLDVTASKARCMALL